MAETVFQRSLAAGELAPVLHASADVAKYQTGLRTCRNFLVRREGGVSNRAGYRFVEACRSHDFGTRLLRYVGTAPDASYLIEMGEGYLRFFQGGALVYVDDVDDYDAGLTYQPGDLVVAGGQVYYATTEVAAVEPPNATYWYLLPGGALEVPTPYTLATLPDWQQSGNVIVLTSRWHAPRELVYLGGARWVLRLASTVPSSVAPENVLATVGVAGTRTFRYVVTATDAAGEESPASVLDTLSSAGEPTVDDPHTVSWDAVDDAEAYDVYVDPYGNGIYGWLGTSLAPPFLHTGQIADFSLTPPVPRVLFDADGAYPAHAAYYQQRRWYAHTLDAPDALWGSRIGFPSNFGISTPLQDDDSVTFRLAGNNSHPIRAMVALRAGLVLLTDGGEWTMTGGGGPRSPITPSSVDALQETYVGVAPDVRPVVVGHAILYVQARGSILRELHFDQAIEGLGGRDLTVFATHLLERRTIRAMDYQQVPHSITWCLRSDGTLLGLTYVPEQEVWGWHRHDTDGQVEDLCVVPEDEEDVLYLVVRRTIGGLARRYLERLERRELLEGFLHATSFFVDSGLSYSGDPVTTFAGLDHLEGKIVAVLADGVVVSDGHPPDAEAARWTVTGGVITLDTPASNVHIGLPIVADLATLDLDVEGASVRAKAKRIVSLTLLVERSSRTFQAGQDLDHLRGYEPHAWEPSALATGQLELTLTSGYSREGRIVVRQTAPLPLTVLGILPAVDLGG